MTWHRIQVPNGVNLRAGCSYHTLAWNGAYPMFTIEVYELPQAGHRVRVLEHTLFQGQPSEGQLAPWPTDLLHEVIGAIQEAVEGGKTAKLGDNFGSDTVRGEGGVLLDDLQRRVVEAKQRGYTLGAYHEGNENGPLILFDYSRWDLTVYWEIVQHSPELLTADERVFREGARELWDDAETTMAILASFGGER